MVKWQARPSARPTNTRPHSSWMPNTSHADSILYMRTNWGEDIISTQPARKYFHAACGKSMLRPRSFFQGHAIVGGGLRNRPPSTDLPYITRPTAPCEQKKTADRDERSMWSTGIRDTQQNHNSSLPGLSSGHGARTAMHGESSPVYPAADAWRRARRKKTHRGSHRGPGNQPKNGRAACCQNDTRNQDACLLRASNTPRSVRSLPLRCGTQLFICLARSLLFDKKYPCTAKQSALLWELYDRLKPG